jgi:hypothetical protein
MDWSQAWSLLWSLIGVVGTALISWLTTKLIQWLNSKTKNEKVKTWNSQLISIISSAVTSVMQTYVDALKKEGKFDETAQAEAKQKALDIITGQLTDELKKYITDNFGDIKEYLSTQIEAMVHSLKS